MLNPDSSRYEAAQISSSSKCMPWRKHVKLLKGSMRARAQQEGSAVSKKVADETIAGLPEAIDHVAGRRRVGRRLLRD
jgi:hypothetical protein